MVKSRILLLTTGLILLFFILVLILPGIERETGQEEKNQQEIVIREVKEETEQEEINWQWLEKQKPMYQLSEAEIKPILKELHRQFPDKEERLKALALWRLGTPYKLGCLGEETGRDKNPIFRTDVADCTVFVLTNVALLHAETLAEARDMMKFLNYRSEEITYENRLHFSTDRNEASPYFKDITHNFIEPEKIRQKEVVLNKTKEDGQRLIDIDWQKTITLKYIPYDYITSEFLQTLPVATGIAFVGENDSAIGLDIAHEGFLFDRKTLVHAVSDQGRVVKENFLDYYFVDQSIPRFEGIILFEAWL